jgi:hypothetical protein
MLFRASWHISLSLTLRGVRCSQTYDLSCVLCLVIVNILIYDWVDICLVNRFLDVMVSSCKTQSIFLVPVLDFTKFTHTFLFILHFVVFVYAPIVGLPRTVAAFVFQLFVCCLKIHHCFNACDGCCYRY